MGERRRILGISIGIMVAVAVCVATAAITVINRASFEEHRARLEQVVEHRSRILKAVAAYDSSCSSDEMTQDATATRLSEIVGVYEAFGSWGDTGEFALAKLDGDRIVWLLRRHDADRDVSAATLPDSKLAQPMWRALHGESGIFQVIDYRGEEVLAAYEAIPGLGWGVVAKIDIAEINQPFLRAGLLSAIITLLLTILGVGMMLRITSPLIGRIEARVAERTAELSQAVSEQKLLRQLLSSAASEATLVEEEERRKLAVALHDGLGQLLTVAGMKLGMLRDSVQDPALAAQVREVESVIADADERTSTLSFELSPPTLHDAGLVAAAEWLAGRMEEQFGLHITVEQDGEHWPLDEETRITLFRALSEVLLNTAKHARTDRVSVYVGREDQFVRVSIEDEGIGFDPGADTGGFGLFSIRERLEYLGGRMQIESEPGEGTRIHLMAPITEPAPEGSRGSA